KSYIAQLTHHFHPLQDNTNIRGVIARLCTFLSNDKDSKYCLRYGHLSAFIDIL
ncbi:hypothetical protein M9458_037740, partial [Cirrhinus mrigala]